MCMHISPQAHHLLYGGGFQTWEYSPAYALRSYGYILIHIFPLLATNTTNKVGSCFLVCLFVCSFVCVFIVETNNDVFIVGGILLVEGDTGSWLCSE